MSRARRASAIVALVAAVAVLAVAAAGMTLLLLGALAAHGRARDRARELLPVLATLAITTAYLAVAL